MVAEEDHCALMFSGQFGSSLSLKIDSKPVLVLYSEISLSVNISIQMIEPT